MDGPQTLVSVGFQGGRRGDETIHFKGTNVILEGCSIPGVGVRKVAIAVVLSVVCLGCANSDSSSSREADGNTETTVAPLPTTPQGDVELCSLVTKTLPGSAQEPATNDALAESLHQRADALKRVAGVSGGDLAEALTLSSNAMKNLAEAVAADADPGALNKLIADLEADAAFASAQGVIDDAVTAECGEGDE